MMPPGLLAVACFGLAAMMGLQGCSSEEWWPTLDSTAKLACKLRAKKYVHAAEDLFSDIAMLKCKALEDSSAGDEESPQEKCMTSIARAIDNESGVYQANWTEECAKLVVNETDETAGISSYVDMFFNRTEMNFSGELSTRFLEVWTSWGDSDSATTAAAATKAAPEASNQSSPASNQSSPATLRLSDKSIGYSIQKVLESNSGPWGSLVPLFGVAVAAISGLSALRFWGTGCTSPANEDEMEQLEQLQPVDA